MQKAENTDPHRTRDQLCLQRGPQGALASRRESPRTVLVIDDQEMILDVARSMLEATGYAVLTASNGEEGLCLLGARIDDIAVVLLDVRMPRMSGLEVYLHIRELSRHLPVLLSSGFNEKECIEQFPGDGQLTFIQKPYELNQLVAKVNASIHSSGREGPGMERSRPPPGAPASRADLHPAP